MQKPSLRGWRVLAIVSVALLLQIQLASVVVAAGQGRQVSPCVNACNAVQDDCIATCASDCSVYPAGSTEYNDCYNPCYHKCITNKQDCKLKCNVRRQHSPSEP